MTPSRVAELALLALIAHELRRIAAQREATRFWQAFSGRQVAPWVSAS